MGNLESLNQAISYIEDHLTAEIDQQKLAQIAGCSQYQFQRMFPYLTGISVTEYVRRRRMTMAAHDLQTTDRKVIDVAQRYGYDSPTAFNRAFKSVVGVSPRQAKLQGSKLSLYPRLVFTLSVKGDTPMNYKLIEQSAFRVVGIPSNNGAWNLEDAGEKATEYWASLDTRIHDIINLMDGSTPEGLLGAQFCTNGEFDCYMACVATSQPCPEGMEERMVEGGTYAVFECKGAMPDAMTTLWHRILTEWLPASGYTWANGTDVERYLTPKMTSPDSKSEVWLPVVKASR